MAANPDGDGSAPGPAGGDPGAQEDPARTTLGAHLPDLWPVGNHGLANRRSLERVWAQTAYGGAVPVSSKAALQERLEALERQTAAAGAAIVELSAGLAKLSAEVSRVLRLIGQNGQD